MKKMGLNEIRERYLSFFERKGHLRHASFSLVPNGDASLLLINAGMAPLKPYFSGEVTPPAPRMTTCQKCIRTPDIERVGKTSRHGTFFEMLGNFSFGNYFKREAILWAWEFLTQELEIPAGRLYVTVHVDDDEAEQIWIETGVPKERITRFDEDNFWEIGSGPCGPCSEIFFDRGEQYGCGKETCGVGCDCDRYVEQWNLVFTQFDSDGKGTYTPLAAKNIDTGMGLERIACTMQDVGNLFEVDTIQEIMKHISEIAGIPYKQNEKTDISLRVITDHIRSTTMLVSDGVLPSNEGRGYVLRRLLRRAARHGRLLGIEKSFLRDVCKTVIRESAGAYPELLERAEFIEKVIAMEEERFAQTIDSGMKQLGEMIARMRSAGEQTLSGEEAFKLYDTYGFPVDLTAEILTENHLALDQETFGKLMQEQRVRARSARASLGDVGWTSTDLGLDKDTRTLFTGYDRWEEQATVLAIVAEGEISSQALAGQELSVILDKTPFYAESGGQVADTGVLLAPEGRMAVQRVQKLKDGKFIHFGTLEEGMLNIQDTVTASIDPDRRRAIMRAHSATHLLQKALRTTLGTHVEQAGSLVEPDSFRFDFTHYSALTSDEIGAIEREVNERILDGMGISVREMPIDEAKKLGAMALFGEKYESVVRVVRMGDYSLELCGGTHQDNTAKIGPFKIFSETSIAAGVRRIEAKVGKAVLDEINALNALVFAASDALKTTPKDLKGRITQMMEENRTLSREVEKARGQEQAREVDLILLKAKDLEGIRLVTAVFPDADAATLRSMGDLIVNKDPDIVAVLSSTAGDKVAFLAVCGKNAIAHGMHAGNIIREVTKIAGGSGGGKPESAMGGGKDATKIRTALESVDGYIKQNRKG